MRRGTCSHSVDMDAVTACLCHEAHCVGSSDVTPDANEVRGAPYDFYVAIAIRAANAVAICVCHFELVRSAGHQINGARQVLVGGGKIVCWVVDDCSLGYRIINIPGKLGREGIVLDIDSDARSCGRCRSLGWCFRRRFSRSFSRSFHRCLGRSFRRWLYWSRDGSQRWSPGWSAGRRFDWSSDWAGHWRGRAVAWFE